MNFLFADPFPGIEASWLPVIVIIELEFSGMDNVPDWRADYHADTFGNIVDYIEEGYAKVFSKLFGVSAFYDLEHRFYAVREIILAFHDYFFGEMDRVDQGISELA